MDTWVKRQENVTTGESLVLWEFGTNALSVFGERENFYEESRVKPRNSFRSRSSLLSKPDVVYVYFVCGLHNFSLYLGWCLSS